jgi:16S rRNA G966 N2-methylase RsmD
MKTMKNKTLLTAASSSSRYRDMQPAHTARLYARPLPSTRTGSLYNAFPYPTKISPEAVAVFIACHTKPGAVVLDTFAGSGSTGLGALLCDKPTLEMKRIAKELGASPVWGPRTAILYEVGVLGAFVSRTMCNPPNPQEFEKYAHELLAQVASECAYLYQAQDPHGKIGEIRHIIWSDVIVCHHCHKESLFWDVAVKTKPLHLATTFVCPLCKAHAPMDQLERATEKKFDPILNKTIIRKKRVPARIHGRTGKTNWQRPANESDVALIKKIEGLQIPSGFPLQEIQWGELHRSGYHTGITHVHHFYTRRNLFVLTALWNRINKFPEKIQGALRLLVLGYNAAHSTLMTRVVIKNGQNDFILTGAQSGVLYISSLPVEKNIFRGLERKIGTFTEAFATVDSSRSKVMVHNSSSTNLRSHDSSVDYVFTDPPFGDYIPYAEINQISEAWLGKNTDRRQEIIVSPSQNKGISDYGVMMAAVFKEIGRVLKLNGTATVVFHSAKASVWHALTHAFTASGFSVRASSILDKVQTSFKQTASGVSVKGDPMLLLDRSAFRQQNSHSRLSNSSEQIIQQLLVHANNGTLDKKERTTERLYSRYVSNCLEGGLQVELDAAPFYKRFRSIEKLQ